MRPARASQAVHTLRQNGPVASACWGKLLTATSRRAPALAVGLAAGVWFVAAPSALAMKARAVRAEKTVRLGTTPRHPAGARVIGALAGSTRIRLTITLQPRDAPALASYATDVSTPGSSVFRNYLTVAEFRQRFAPTDAQIETVQRSLEADGLGAGTVTPNGLSIELSATATTLGRAFSTSFNRFALPNGRTAYANTEAPQLASSVAGAVQSVIGLSDLATLQPLDAMSPRSGVAPQSTSHVVTGGPQPCQDAIAAGNPGYTADQLASAYGFSGLYGEGDEGAGQTVALFELEPNLTSDIAAYQSCYGTGALVSYQPVDGGAGVGAGSGEAAMDIEDIIGLAPKAHIIVYQSPNSASGAFDTYSTMITDDNASVISTSWGLCEPELGSRAAEAENTLFEEAAAQGISVFAAAGDDGSEACLDPSAPSPDTSLAVNDPGSQPFVTGVGGTSLTALGPPPTQSVWNDDTASDECSDGPCGGGGGVSSFWPMPSYQANAPSGLNVINGNSSGTPCGAAAGSYCREVPDVSADADPLTGYVIYYNGGWMSAAGTSAAAPLWAAFTALVDASPDCAGRAIGFANPDLYAAAASDYSANFSDVTSGDNDIVEPQGGDLYPAGPGYDMASGLGTPIGSSLPGALCSGGITVTQPGDQTGFVAAPVSLPILASAYNAATLTYEATGLPPGLSIDPTTGVISGTPTVAGVFTVNVAVTDQSSIGSGSGAGTGSGNSSGAGSATTSFSWNVASRAAPKNTGAPAIAGSATSGASLSCEPGVWANDPVSFTYQWSRNGTPIAGATGPSYKIRVADEGSILTCTVSASSAAGTGRATSTKGVSVAVPRIAGCPAATGLLSGTKLGLARLGQTRKQALSAYAHHKDHSTPDTDLFCLTPSGVEVDYPSAALLTGDSKKQRAKLDGHVIWLETANAHYAIDGIYPGATLAAAQRALPHGALADAAGSEWYLARHGAVTAVIEAGGGIVQQVGIASKQFTGGAKSDKAFLKAFA